jgi:hypothetical protein
LFRASALCSPFWGRFSNQSNVVEASSMMSTAFASHKGVERKELGEHSIVFNAMSFVNALPLATSA